MRGAASKLCRVLSVPRPGLLWAQNENEASGQDADPGAGAAPVLSSLWIETWDPGILVAVGGGTRTDNGAPGRGTAGIGMKRAVKEPGLDEIVERLRRAYEPERIYLFGSRARGDDGPDSDFDLLVVVPDDAPRERRGSRLAYQALRGTGVAADILVWTRAYFESRRHLKASLSSTVASEGRLLYAA